MREYLFRGKLLNGKWAFGNLDVKPNGIAIITPDDTLVGCYGQVDPETVGQFTGLTDKNGVKIFEGDIIRVRNCNHAVRYIPCAFVFTNNDLILNEGLFMNNPVEVVGNIHDNPELLQAA